MAACKPLTPPAHHSRRASAPLAHRSLPATRCSGALRRWNRPALLLLLAAAAGGDHRWFETLVRTAAPGGGYSTARVGVPRELLLSHNVAVLCERGRWLVACGGAHERGSEDWRRRFRRDARVRRRRRAELAWSRPRLVIPGAPAAANYRPDGGAAVRYDGGRGALPRADAPLPRSNLVPTGGGRRVQVASSVDGVTGWTCFERHIDGVRAFVPSSTSAFGPCAPCALATAAAAARCSPSSRR